MHIHLSIQTDIQINIFIMLVVSSREFKINAKKYFDIALNDMEVFIKRGRDTFLLTPVNDATPKYSPAIMKRLEEAKANRLKGNVSAIKDNNNVWDSIL